MRLHFVEGGPALLVENTRRVLVIADLHMGIESGFARHGVHIASRSDARVQRAVACVEATDPDLLLLLGDVKHNVPITSRQEFQELPRVIDTLRALAPLRVAPGNHDGGLPKFLRPDELLPVEGALIDGVGYLHGHTHPAPDLLGHLVVLGHHHPVVSLQDAVGCAARAQPAFLYAGLHERCLPREEAPGRGASTRLLFVPSFNELAGGIEIVRIRESGLSPLSRCMNESTAEVYLADGTYVGSLASLCPAEGR